MWGGGLTPDTYGGSFYGGYGVRNGSYGSDEHGSYQTAVEAAAQDPGAQVVHNNGRWGVMFMVSDGYQQVGTFDGTGTPIMMETFSPEFLYVATPEQNGQGSQGWLDQLLGWTDQFFGGGNLPISDSRSAAEPDIFRDNRNILHTDNIAVDFIPAKGPGVPNNLKDAIIYFYQVADYSLNAAGQVTNLLDAYSVTHPQDTVFNGWEFITQDTLYNWRDSTKIPKTGTFLPSNEIPWN